jgi:3-hydroxymyristoyl/3-hydroxydecanoyl-(acyl carrier protein) dehydratase
MITADINEIQNRIIHRHENVLLDSVTYDPENTDDNELSITLSRGDTLNRDIFLKQKKRGEYVVVTSVFMEILALSCIITENKLKEGDMVIFAAISNFKKLGEFPENTTITGNCVKISDKKGFLRYKGTLNNGDTCIASGDMMAYFTKEDTQAEIVKEEELPPLTMKKTLPINEELKSKWITMCDTLRHVDESSCVTEYTYPDNHPFIKGHFPGNPLMMGVMQWLSIESCIFAYANEKGLKGHHVLVTDAVIQKTDGSLVAEVKKAVIDVWIDDENIVSQAEIRETKKIVFRNMVKPTETIYIHCSNITPA